MNRMRITGKWLTAEREGQQYKLFLPSSLPPFPPVHMGDEMLILYSEANRALGRLDNITGALPDPHLFVYQYIRREALLSSQIEGTQSSFSDLLLFERNALSGRNIFAIGEVVCYVRALSEGVKRIKRGDPLSLRMICELHSILLSTGRGSKRRTGEFRREQNWIGGNTPQEAEFVPPPHERLSEFLHPMEEFLHAKHPDALLKAALVHVQFLTIHPFVDGNGRMARMLVALMLCAQEVLADPLLYLSLYFKQNRQEYYDRLQAVRTRGDWESWTHFFLTGVRDTAHQAVETAHHILGLFAEDEQAVQNAVQRSSTQLRILKCFQKHPFQSANDLKEALALSHQAIMSSLRMLEAMNILKEMSGRRRNQYFCYTEYLDLLSVGAEPIP